MNTGIQCKADPDCPVPAPLETGICHYHQRAAALKVMRESPSAATRALGRILTLAHRHDREPEAGA